MLGKKSVSKKKGGPSRPEKATGEVEGENICCHRVAVDWRRDHCFGRYSGSSITQLQLRKASGRTTIFRRLAPDRQAGLARLVDSL